MTQATTTDGPTQTLVAPTKLRVAVTGGSGNIGTAVVRELLLRGHEVTVLDRRAPRVEGVRFVFIDLRDRQVLQPVLERVDAVIHLGEIPNENAGTSPQDVYASNTAAGSTVLQTAADLKLARVIYTSSCQVYGIWGGIAGRLICPAKFPIDETQPLNPLNPYSLAKVANEGYARILAARQGLSVAIMRLPIVIGTGQRHRQMMRWMSRPKWYMEQCDGFWTFVHEEDVARAYTAAIELEHRVPGAEAYNLIASDILGHEPLRERLAAMEPPALPQLPDEWPERGAPVDTSKARNRLGWTPRHTYESLVTLQESEAKATSA